MQPKGDEINGLRVDPGWHGRGIGTRLLRAGETVIRGSGHARAWLTCSAFNPRAAGFYRSRGYAEERRDMTTHRSGVPEELLIFAGACRPDARRACYSRVAVIVPPSPVCSTSLP